MLRQKSVAQDAEVSTVPTLCKFDHSCDDDHDEREDLGHRADDLKNGAPFHFHGVHKGQQAWLKQREQSETARDGWRINSYILNTSGDSYEKTAGRRLCRREFQPAGQQSVLLS